MANLLDEIETDEGYASPDVGEGLLDFAEDQLEVWQEEGFDEYEDYADHYVRHVKHLLTESENEWLSTKDRHHKVYKRFELEDLIKSYAYQNPVYADVPIMPPVIEEIVAMLCESVPNGFVEGPGPEFDDTAAASNTFLSKIREDQDYDYQMVEMVTDAVLSNTGVFTMRGNPAIPGPFGLDGEITIEKLDPKDCWFDPFCKRASSRLRDQRFFIVTQPKDLSELILMFGDVARAVKSESTADNEGENKGSGSAIKFNRGSDNEEDIQHDTRGRAVLIECWLRDDQTECVPMFDDKGKLVKDADGNVIMREQLKYPHGRVLYVANNVLLRDIPNPFKHGHMPFAFYNLRVGTKPLSWGIAELLMLEENKIMKLDRQAYETLLYNLSSPWIGDDGFFVEREDADSLTNAPDQVILGNQGFTLRREPPGIMPPDRAIIRGEYLEQFDALSATGGINRGDVQKGAQMSAQAIEQLQGAGGARNRLRQQNLGRFVKEVHYQLFHLITQLYTKSITVMVTGPDGQQKPVKWNPTFDKDKYQLRVEAGSGLPGAKQGAVEMAFRLYGVNAIDRMALLQAVKWPHLSELLARMKQWDMLKLSLLEDPDYKGNKNGSAGRKVSYGG